MFTKTLGYGFAVVIGSCVLVGSISTRSVVRVDESALAEVRRAHGDGLDNVATIELVCGASEALAACTSWDIKENCCPAGCAAKKGSNWSKADDILRGCIRGLGCSENEVNGATVFMKCDCDKK